MAELSKDLIYAVRMLRKSPGLTATIVLSLAIGIGANTAIFSVVDALLLRPLPYPEPNRLATLWLRSPGIGIDKDWPSPGQYSDILKQNHSFEEISISHGEVWTLTGLQQPERIEALRTSSNLFRLLGAKALYGRLFVADDDKAGKPPVVVLSHGAWQRLFGGDPSIVGRGITLNSNPFTVIGVLSPSFHLDGEVMETVSGTRRMDMFAPLPQSEEFFKRRGDENYNLIGRLKPGVTAEQAQADISVIASRLREQDHRDRTFTIFVLPLLDQVVGNVRRAVLVLLGAVALVLLIACANVANLLLSRATGRQKEIAIRTALGAGWQRLVRQLLTESVLLGFLGGIAGLAVAWWCLYIVRTINPGNIPRMNEIGIDPRVLAFTFAVSILTGMVFGIAPATRAAKVDLNTSLKSGGRSSQGAGGLNPGRHRLRALLVVAELGLSLMLLIGAGLLVRSFIRLGQVSPGFNPEGVISMRLNVIGAKYRRPSPDVEHPIVALYRRIGERISRLPGVQAEGATSVLPLTASISWGGVEIENYTPPADQPEIQADMRGVTPGYFRTMQIPLRAGRLFDDRDQHNTPKVLVADEKMAQRFWPKGDAVGKRIRFGKDSPWMTVVGVVATVKQYGLAADTRIAFYMPHTQMTAGGLYVVARTAGNPASLSSAVIREIHAIDPDIAAYDVQTMPARLHDSLARQRFSMVMLGAFAAFALVLAAVGIYGVMSYLVTQGTHDIGVRIALGAQRGSIVGMVIRQAMAVAGIGIVAGLIGAAALTQLMGSLLFGVQPRDLLTFSAVAVFLTLVALFAAYLPALRATRIDPLIALREE
jgi:predicted permease